MSRHLRTSTCGHMRPANIKSSLRIRTVWSLSSVGAFWIAKEGKFLHADNEGSSQTVWMRMLIFESFVWRTCQKVRFLMLRFHSTLETRCQGAICSDDEVNQEKLSAEYKENVSCRPENRQNESIEGSGYEKKKKKSTKVSRRKSRHSKCKTT